MPRRRASIAPRTPIEEVIDQQIAHGAEISKIKQPGPSALQAGDFEKYEAPVPWELLLHHPGAHTLATELDPLVYYHPGQSETALHEAVEAGWKRINGGGKFEIIVTDPIGDPVEAKSYGTLLMVPYDLDGTRLRHAAAGLGTVGGATIQYVNETTTNNMLSTPITIPGGSHTSYISATQSTGVIDEGASLVATGHMISINVLASGGGKGLIVVLHFA